MRKPRKVDPEKEQHWRDVFEQFHASGLPFRHFCQKHGLSENTFQYWRKELRKRDELLGTVSRIRKGENRPSETRQKIEFWLRAIEEINAYSGSIRSYCISRGITSGSLYHWEKRLREMKLTKGLRKSLTTDEPVPEKACVEPKTLRSTPELPEDRIEVRLKDGTTIFMPAVISIDFLVKVVSGLRG